MKRKIFVLLTILCLIIKTYVTPMQIISAETAVTASPEVQDTIYGFKLTKMDYNPTIKSNRYLFVHEKTGAKLLVIKNNDKNRGFSIKFNTPTDNDKGINHIIEHCILGGSKNYPCNNILFDLMNTTYTSYANAVTYQNMTLYPICSGSEKQLLKSADIYLDAVFNPLFLTDKRIFEREGWRYELADKASDLIYNGIVYNEMQGDTGSIEAAAYYNANKAIFSDSNQGNIPGGSPDKITASTYKEIIDTYKKNYHPSNCFMVLYGDVNYEAFLKLIDENYLSSYTKQTYTDDRTVQKAFHKMIEKTYTYPAAKGKVAKNSSVIDLVFAADDMKKLGPEDYVGLNIAVSLLNNDTSTIKKAMLNSKIAASYRITLDSTTYQPSIHFIATNADPSKKKDFYNLIMKELNQIVINGLDNELLKSSLRSIEFSQALGSSNNTAFKRLFNASMYDTLIDDPFFIYAEYNKQIVPKLKDKFLENLIQKQIISNKTIALTVTTPKAGLFEKMQTAKVKELEKIKTSMTQKQMDDLIRKTKDLTTWINKKTSPEVLKSLRAVSLKDLSIELRDRNIKESIVDGAKLWTAQADVDSVCSIYLTFDLSHLTAEELLYLKFYGEMMANAMATEKRTESQVINDMIFKTCVLNASVDAFRDDKTSSSAHPVFTVNYYSFNDEYADTFDLVSDMLLQSKVSDVSIYGTRIITYIKSYYQNLLTDPSTLVLNRTLAYTSPLYQYKDYLNGLNYYDFILKLEKQLALNPAEVIDKIKAVREKAFNKNNLTILLAGDLSAQESFKSLMPQFTQKLPDKIYPKAVYTLPLPAKREAIATNSAVQYLCVNGSLSANLVSMSGKSNVITRVLNNLFLVPEIRLKGGAYDVSANMGDNCYYTFTYRDNNFINSMTTIDRTDEFLKELSSTMTEDNLDDYKLSAYAAVTQSTGEIDDAISVLLDKCQGITTQDKIYSLKELKEATLTDLQDYANHLEKINTDLNYVVVASANEIEANKNLFDAVITFPQ